MHVGIQPLSGGNADAAAERRAGGGGVMGRRVPATVLNSSPPTSHASLPSISPTLSAVNTLSNTFSSLAGLVGRASAPAADSPPSVDGDAAPDPPSAWAGGAFDRLPGRWKSSRVETVLILHTRASVSLFVLPCSSNFTTACASVKADLREILRVSSSTLGEGVVVGARVVPPSTVKGTEWSLLVILETPAAAGRTKVSLSLLSLPSLELVASRSLSGSLTDIKTSSHTVAVATAHPTTLHMLSPTSLTSICPPLAAPAIALSADRKPIFDVRGRLVVYASAEAAPKGTSAILRSTAGGRKLEEGAAGLSRLSRSRRTSAAMEGDLPEERSDGQPSSSQSRPIPTPSSATLRRSSATSASVASSSPRSVVVISLTAPRSEGPVRRLAHFPSDGVTTLALSPSASKLILSTFEGHHSFSVLAIRPQGPAALPDAKAAVWETHVLHRGLTPARLEAVAWSDDDRWVATKTAKGTTHFWLLGSGRQGLSDGRDVCVRVRQPATVDRSIKIGFAFARRPGGPSSASLEQDVVFFDAAGGQHVSLHRLLPPRAQPKPIASTSLLPASPSQGSALSLMMSASRKAQALVAASTASVLDGGHGEGAEWEVARWEVGSLSPEAASVALTLRPEAPSASLSGDPIALALSHAEIETSTPSMRVLPGPIYLSHQFSFSKFSSTALPRMVPLPLSQIPMQRLIVRSEVIISRLPALDAVHSLSSSVDSFNEPLSSAIHSSLVPHSRSLSGKPVVPSYPNGDGLTTSPRSWKSSAVGMPIVVGARSLGDGLVRVRHEVGRIASPSGSLSSRQRRAKQSTSKSSGSGSLSFEEDAVYDPSEFQQTSAGSGSFAPSSFSTDPEEPWEDDEEENEEGYRALVEEEASFDDLVLGVMDEDDGRDGTSFQPHSVPRSTSILGLGAPSLKSSASPLAPATLPPPLVAVQQQDEDDCKPSSDSSASAASLTKEERKALNKARKKAARGGASVPTTPVTGATSMVIARSTSATGREESLKPSVG